MRLKNLIVPAFAALAGSAGAVEAPTTQVTAVSDLASLLEGEFTTQPAPNDAQAAKATGPILYDFAKRVQVPGLGHDVVYEEMREGTREGRILRQLLYALKLNDDDGVIVMTVYKFGNPSAYAGVYADATPLAKLNVPDLEKAPAGCEIGWKRVEAGFKGNIRDKACAWARAAADGMPTIPAYMNVEKTELVQSAQPAVEGKPPAGAVSFRRLR